MSGKNEFYWITFCLVLILVIGSVTSIADFDDTDFQSITIVTEPERGNMVVAGIPHAPIVIDGDVNFSDTAFAEGWTGDGSSETPYLIDSLDIDPGVVNSHCINIINTRVNFTIMNCFLSGADVDYKAGIYMRNVTNGVVLNNIFTNNCFDIRLRETHSILIKNNTCTSSIYESIDILDSYSILIKNNTCTASTDHAIRIDRSSDNIITDNNCSYNSGAGIIIRSLSDFNTIVNNTYISNSEGINVDGTSNTVVNNTCSGNIFDGIYLDGSHNIAANNTCAFNVYGMLLDGSYNTAANNTCIDNDYGIWISGWHGTATTNNCTNSDYGITADGTSNLVANNTCNDNNQGITSTGGIQNTVINNTCKYNINGILALGDSNNFVDNTCSHNSESGMLLSSSDPFLITNNTCNYNGYFGIYISFSGSNTVSNNTCNYNERHGIFIEMSGPQSVTNNTCNYNDDYGILIYSSDSNTVANNSCNYNIRYGIFIDTSNLNTLTNNTFTNNQVGIYIEGFSSNNNILWNTLIDNVDNGYNGPDGVNLFDYNYWSDYAGNDTDLNGVGDTPYLVSMGFEPFYDYHPLMNPPGYFEWTQLPTDQQLLLGEPLRYDLNVTVYGDPDYWWINDTLNFAIDQSGVITNNTFLLAQNYGLQVYVNATYGSILSGIFTVSIEDWFSPGWLEEPVNQIVEYGTSLNYEMNAIDPSGLDIWWLNDTLHFTVDDTGLATTIGVVPVGAYGLQVWVNDTWGNTLTGFFTVTVVDTLAPTWTEVPQNQTIEYGSTFVCNLNATDLSGIDEWWVDDTTRFDVSYIGHVRLLAILEPGIYGLQVYVSDIYGNIQSAAFLVEIVDTTSPEWLSSVIDQYLEYGEHLEYQLSAYDLSGIDHWNLNDTTNFAIDSLGFISSIGSLEPGLFNLRVTVTDPYGNELSAEFTVHVNSEPTSTTTTSATTTSTTTNTTTSTQVNGIDPLLSFGMGVGVGGLAVFVVIIVLLKKRS